MKAIMKMGIITAMLMSSHAMAAQSKQCDKLLFDGVDNNDSVRFVVCENGKRMSTTLTNIENNKVIETLDVPKLYTSIHVKGDMRLFMVMRDGTEEGGGYGYTENIAEDTVYRFLMIREKGGDFEKPEMFRMAKPRVDKLKNKLDGVHIVIKDDDE